MSQPQFPPQGTKCKDCGCCQATVYAGNDPLCWECDGGELCKAKKAREPSALVRQLEVPVARPSIQTSAEPQAPRVIQARVIQAPAPRPRATLISREVKEAILAEPRTLSGTKVAKKYGVSGFTVSLLRRDGLPAAFPILVELPKTPETTPETAPETPQEAPMEPETMLPPTPEPDAPPSPESAPTSPAMAEEPTPDPALSDPGLTAPTDAAADRLRAVLAHERLRLAKINQLFGLLCDPDLATVVARIFGGA